VACFMHKKLHASHYSRVSSFHYTSCVLLVSLVGEKKTFDSDY
jgi:hypothetical protein